jgi:hypothetical protein
MAAAITAASGAGGVRTGRMSGCHGPSAQGFGEGWAGRPKGSEKQEAHYTLSRIGITVISCLRPCSKAMPGSLSPAGGDVGAIESGK